MRPIGIEEELYLVDSASGELHPSADTVLRAVTVDLGERIRPEFLQCQIESRTPISHSIGEAREALVRQRAVLRRAAARHGLNLVASATHPWAHWVNQAPTELPRYRQLDSELRIVGRRLLTCGLHIHVGIDDLDLRVAVMTAARPYLPLLLALSASSPFWVGRDTGMASYRSAVFSELPRTGIPDAFASGANYLAALQALVDSGAIDDPTKVWWDIRAHPRLPTLEYRIADMTPRADHVLALAALCQALTEYLIARIRQGEAPALPPRYLIAENKWRAACDGLTGSLIDLNTNRLRRVPELIAELIERLTPAAAALGSLEALHGIEDLLLHGSSAERQREVYRREASWVAVAQHLVQETTGVTHG
ncbi:MAG TPA: carboxylate-amine ligase [Anaerolineae bacterium]|nr:carboxylate-amine ligase [Anaerolineae bacterium]